MSMTAWLNNYPPGMPRPRREYVRHECPECGAEWEVLMTWELGRYSYLDGQYERPGGSLCPNGCEENCY